jgi:transcriptional regulator with XRE-family HTH domain
MPDEVAARLRAAFAYANMSKADRAAVLQVSARTVTRIESGEVQVAGDKLADVAKATGVPMAFFEDGWPNGTPLPVERVDKVEFELETLRGQVSQLRAGLTALAGGTLPTLPERQAPDGRDRPGEHQAGNG